MEKIEFDLARANPYSPPSASDERRHSWPVFPFWELLSLLVLGLAVLSFSASNPPAGMFCTVAAFLLAVVAISRRNSE